VTGGGAAGAAPAVPARVTCWGELRGERPLPGVLRVLVDGQSAGGIERAGDGWRVLVHGRVPRPLHRPRDRR